MLEAFFMLVASDYTARGLQAKLGHMLDGTPGPGLLVILQISAYLKGVSRPKDAQEVSLWFYDLTASDLADSRRIADKVRRRSRLLPPHFFPIIVHGIPLILHSVLKPNVLLGLVENLFEVTDDVYGSPSALAERIGLNEGTEQSFVLAITLLQALTYSHQYAKSLALLRALLFASTGETPTEIRDILAKLKRLVDRLPGYHQAALQARILHTLFGLGDLHVAAVYAESLFGLAPEEYAEGVPRLAELLRAAQPGFAPEETPLLFTQLIATLGDMPGRESDSQKLLEAYIWHVQDLTKMAIENAITVPIICRLLERWLALTSTAEAFPRCAEIVRFVRSTLNLHGVRYEDRINFGNEIAELRKRIVQVGREHALGDERAWLDVLAWDVELGQRVLFERYRFHRASPQSDLHAGPPALPELKNGWSFPEKAPETDNYIPPLCADGYWNGRLGRSEEPAERVQTQPVDLAEAPDERYRAGERIIAQGITVREIAQILGTNGVLLRAGFALDGRLVWTAFRSHDGSLSLLAHGRSVHAGALDEIRSAVRWHDGLLDRIWSDGPLHAALSALVPYVECVAKELGKLPRDGKPNADRLGRMVSALLKAAAAPGLDDWFAPWLRSRVPADWNAALDSARDWKDKWDQLLNSLQSLCNKNLTRRLDAATDAYLEWVSRHWDLTPLVPHLNPKLDLVVEVEEHLHAVPAAFLRVKDESGFNQRLFERVRSVRSSVSLLISLMQPAVSAAEPHAGGTLLTFSWFGAKDPARNGARWLHHGQQLLAQRHNLTWKSASDWTSDSAKLIAESVAASSRIRVLSVCGHGDPAETGIRLRVKPLNDKPSADLWAGEGCDLSGVDWLFSVSCSVGRVAQHPEVPDVAGFTADLLARRARAALACRWPIHSLQAAAFANAVADEYVDSKLQSGAVDRAAALTRARIKFSCNTGGSGSLIGLNTLAAFELYGEG